MEQTNRTPKITKIVITGGPCAGKTTAMNRIQSAFMRQGYRVLFVPETATELIGGGVSPWTCGTGEDFQHCISRLQMEKEHVFEHAAMNMDAEKILIVCDRGMLDNKAYMTEEEFDRVMRALHTNKVDARDRYDAVFHLVTAARGAQEAYTLANNASRTESPEEAIRLDDLLIAAWTGHPHLRVIDNSTGFEEKMDRLLSEIASFLGEPEPYEIERKYLIRFPDLAMLEDLPNCEKVDIMQIYLTGEPGSELRVRQRGSNGHYIYIKTQKRRISDIKRVEIEQRITRDEYLSLLMHADTTLHPIHKTRYCLTENNRYYEIDVYPGCRNQAILEIELRDESEDVVFPANIQIIREVTGDPAYTNYEFAKRMPEGM